MGVCEALCDMLVCKKGYMNKCLLGRQTNKQTQAGRQTDRQAGILLSRLSRDPASDLESESSSLSALLSPLTAQQQHTYN